ncbi:murein transglycosylase A [Yunchengibacter salinarum]|uniref:murein transglycosylase A n=1 Tax=Yunchengibacter salinarum TaxID=3133399 RepID=UPI0035B67DA6
MARSEWTGAGLWRGLPLGGLIALFLVVPVWLALLLATPDAGPRLRFHPVSFDALPGFADDPLTGAMRAFRRSCARLARLPETRAMGGVDVTTRFGDRMPVAGRVSDWRPACAAFDGSTSQGDMDPHAFFREHFQPFAVTLNGRAKGTFTGYYEPVLDAALEKGGRFTIPLHARPDDLVSVDLGAFRDDLKGRSLAGRINGRRLVPYADRAAIEAGALGDRAEVLAYTDSAVDAFFLHVQGSGRLRLRDGRMMAVGYAGQNGHPYFSIGRALIQRGEIPARAMSMQRLKRWLMANPDRGAALMRENARYVFFRRLPDGAGPVGSAGVVLTPRRSLAVDRAFLPLHAPVFLAARRPVAGGGCDESVPFRRLMVAQDTGAAIRGEIRGDVFWGRGEEARAIAGRMAHGGRYFLLLPRAVAERLAP